MSENNLSKFHEIERQETEFIKVLESFKFARFLVKKESETLPDSVCIVCAFGFGLLSVACYQLKRHGTFFSSPKKFNGQMWQNKNDPLDDFTHVNFLVG